MPFPFFRILQTASLVITSLVVGAMFGIWGGYNPVTYSSATVVEVLQGAVRGLNALLPAMGLAAIAMAATLAFLARRRRPVFWLHAGATAALAVAGIVTRFGNQPLNDIVMSWGTTPPEGWQALRDTWWNWHLARLGAGLVGEVLLINAILADHSQRASIPAPTPSAAAGKAT